jgi:molecular chaperone GrpE
MSEETQNPQDAPNIPEEAPETATAAPEAFVEIPASPETPDPAGQLRVLAEKLAASEDNWLRAKAETENVRRRAQEDVAKAHKFAIEKFAGELLAVKDSL